MYVFTYADCIYVPIKNNDLTSEKNAVYIIIGVDSLGFKDILGMWINETESASFWTNVFEDLKERGLEDILYMSSDGIAGFKGSLETVFKVLFLRIQDLTEKWKKPIQNWKTIQAQLMELFGERYTKYLEV